MTYSYRKAVSADYAVICAFPKDSMEVFFMSPKLEYPLTSDQLEQAAQGREKLTVILNEDEQVIGYANLYYEQERDLYWLGNVIVSPDYRGKGAAKFLIRTMLAAAKEDLKLRELHLVCHNVNTKGMLLYSRLGFKPYEIVKRTGPQESTIAGIFMKIELT
ncbi:GNAT family N-acetyltransferase [Paenibacillus sp. G2S3]|uniref:GNAT family N-acetyltransferase n=1 Tax=Paenibacillus sp. G2S3 TaxID=3047872 RepID=UPI0024C1AABE|nr:GNAT family N-acetyltransferase [Paenibacillus sp. G2S3]WHY21903.1 GNAT family N-acetyltransferase [Paenibacillus sp. G2S3]